MLDWPHDIYQEHAVIRNLPNPFCGDPAEVDRAEQLAERLSEMARLVPESAS